MNGGGIERDPLSSGWSEFAIVTGLSGAGRSKAADTFEDLGWFVIDNLPPELIPKVADLARAPGSTTERVALVVDTRTDLRGVLPAISALRETGSRVRIVFLEAATQALVRRYESTRRRHPMGEGQTLSEAIERERAILEPVKAEADVVVDTSELNEHQLRERIVELFGADTPVGTMQVTVTSFGYKHGLPLDADVVLDCRFLPNPHWVEELRPLTGLDDPVVEYVLSQPDTLEFLRLLEPMLARLLPAYVKEGKSYLTIALGCTGGRHRSVVIAGQVADMLRIRGFEPTVTHRDVDR